MSKGDRVRFNRKTLLEQANLLSVWAARAQKLSRIGLSVEIGEYVYVRRFLVWRKVIDHFYVLTITHSDGSTLQLGQCTAEHINEWFAEIEAVNKDRLRA